jgi:hypothetical protein
MAQRPFKQGELVMEPSSSTWVERITAHELRIQGRRTGGVQEGAIGFRNHWTGVIHPPCQACLSILIICGQVFAEMPVPFDCRCRAVKPVGEEAKFYYEPETTRGANYSDLARNGGKDWNRHDWEYLVFQPMRKHFGDRRMDLFLPFVGMLFHLLPLDRDDVVRIPDVIYLYLKNDLGLTSDLEILRFIRQGLGDGSEYISAEQCIEVDEYLRGLAAKDLMSRLVISSSFA